MILVYVCVFVFILYIVFEVSLEICKILRLFAAKSTDFIYWKIKGYSKYTTQYTWYYAIQ